MKTKITKTCPVCNKHFEVPPSMERRKFCSKDCANSAQKTSERREIVCKCCGKTFLAKKDHGKWPVYCSKKCFGINAPIPTEKECPTCKKKFIAQGSSHKESSDKLRKYCSKECFDNKPTTKILKKCANCSKEFYISRSKAKTTPESSCCSIVCQKQYYVLEKNPTWRGGRRIRSDNNIALTVPGYDPQSLEHRIIVEKILGRKLSFSEPVIHLNGDLSDNRLENLYLCSDWVELRKIQHGKIDRPTQSNLLQSQYDPNIAT